LENISVYLSEGGSFTCPNCNNKSKVSKLPTIPGVYKITCYKCKHQVIHKVENPPPPEKESTKEKVQNPTLSSQASSKNFRKQNTDIFPNIPDLPEIKKPFIEVNKVKIPDPIKESNPTQRTKESTDTIFYYLPPFFQSKWLFAFLFLIFFLFVSLGIPLLETYRETESKLDDLLQELNKNKPSLILDRDGEKIAEIYQKKIGSTRLSDYPPLMKEIILNVEDRGFYDHGGIDYIALVRAGIKNTTTMKYSQGASTITQQLARILLKDRRKSISRKYREAMVAIALEARMDKDKILEAYLNQVYLGHGAFGLENAALYYFDKKVKDLKEPMEMILLASLASAPHKYSPFKNKDLARKRVRNITNMLISRKVISDEYASKIEPFFTGLKEPSYATVFGARYDSAPYVTEHVRQVLKSIDPDINIYDVGGYKVETTLSKKAQEIVPEETSAHLIELKALKKISKIKVKETNSKAENTDEVQTAVIGLDPMTGAIIFMHGGAAGFHTEDQFNRAVQMRRQTGSAIKPVLYSAGVDTGSIFPSMKMLDTPLVFRNAKGNIEWSPDNFGQVYEGEISIRDALAKSKNTIAVQIADTLGLNVLEKYYSNYFFFDPDEKRKRFRKDLSISLGSLEISPLEMASAFSNFANDGMIRRPHLVKSIYNADGKKIYSSDDRDEFNLKMPRDRRVISSDSAEIMVSLMRGSANASGIRSTGYKGDLAGKTGTTNDHIDAWFVAVKPGLSMAIWIGYDDPSYGMGKLGMGAELAAPLWGKIAKNFHEKKIISEEHFKFSKHPVTLVTCRASGLLATSDCPEKKSDLFLEDKKPGYCRLSHGVENKDIINNIIP
jgi:penicillin-binding protein 1A